MRLSILILGGLLVSSCSSEDSDDQTHRQHRADKVKFLSIADTVYRFSPGSTEGIPLITDSLALHWPLISSPVNDPKMDSLLYQNFNYSSVMGETIDQTFEEYGKTGTGITDVQYTISYNENGIFSISYVTEYTSAHLSYSHYFVNLDLYDYSTITLDSILQTRTGDEFDALLNKRVHEKLDSVKMGLTREDLDLLEYVFERAWSREDVLGFTLNEDGLNLFMSYEFPEYAKVLEPDGYLIIKWSELNKYLNPAGSVNRIIPANS